MIDHYVWQRMERRLRELPKPPAGTEKPVWMIPSDGLPEKIRGGYRMKIVRSYPSGWNGYPVWVNVDLAAIRFSPQTIDDALLAALRSEIGE